MVVQAESGLAGPRDPRGPQLAAALRDAAAQAVDASGGGIALLFALPPEGEDEPRLRAAAGFPSAEAAREAALGVLEQVRETLREGCVVNRAQPEAALGPRAVAGTLIRPLFWEQRPLGALVVGFPAPADASCHERLAALAEILALRLDHGRLASQEARLEVQVEEFERGQEEKNEEILKLSEALFAQDIELLRSTEKLGKVEKLKSDFIERMSRELRTPLNGIIEAVISVLTGEAETLSDEAKECLRCALDDGTAYLRTLGNILDLWRVKQGELPVEIQDVNFRETVEEAIFSVQDAIYGKPVALEQEIPEPFPKIRTDLTKISQILFLLLDNAVKFTPSGRVTIAAELEEGRLCCRVSDTGIGICSDDQQTIFEEFFQVDDAASTRFRGAGLGLTLARDLVVLLGGEIALESEVGQGSAFSFSIPVQPGG